MAVVKGLRWIKKKIMPLKIINLFFEKWFKQKWFKIKFPTKTHWVYVFISSRSEARGHQKFTIFKIIHLDGKVHSLWGGTLLKVSIISKNALNKSCFKLNFLQIKNLKSRSVRVTKENCYFGLQISVPNPNSLCISCISTCP